MITRRQAEGGRVEWNRTFVQGSTARYDRRVAVRLLAIIRYGAAALRAGDRPEEWSKARHAGTILANRLLGGDGVERPRIQKLRLPASPGRATRGPTMVTVVPPQVGEGRLLLTYGEAATALAVSPRYLRTLVYRGVIPSVRLGRLRRIAAEDLRSFVHTLRDVSSL